MVEAVKACMMHVLLFTSTKLGSLCHCAVSNLVAPVVVLALTPDLEVCASSYDIFARGTLQICHIWGFFCFVFERRCHQECSKARAGAPGKPDGGLWQSAGLSVGLVELPLGRQGTSAGAPRCSRRQRCGLLSLLSVLEIAQGRRTAAGPQLHKTQCEPRISPASAA